MSVISHSRLALAVAAGLVVALAGKSHAYTAEEQQACSPDAFRLCSSEIPDVDRVTACMVRNKSQLSPQCRVFFRPEPGEPAGKPLRLSPAGAEKARAHRIRKPRPDNT